MQNYLLETYFGSDVNMLENSAYYCYTIKDPMTGKFYSGSRGVEGTCEHDLLKKYFTSSTITDFKERLKKSSKLVEYRIEYFRSRAEAFEAEKNFHDQHQVGKNQNFLNSSNAGGTNCGAGSVLCKDSEGKTYRVSVEEFSTGKHQHVSKGMMNIRTDEGIKKIHVSEFDPDLHTTEFKDYVLALDKMTSRTCKIPKSVFNSNTRYVGATKGKVVAYDKINNSTVVIDKEEFENSNGRYVGNTFGLVPVINRITGEKQMIEKEKYDKRVFDHSNSGKLVVYSILDQKIIKISKEEYRANYDNYANLTTKVFYKVDGKFFKSKKALDQYYRKTRGKTLLKVSQYEIQNKFNDVVTITREELENGKN